MFLCTDDQQLLSNLQWLVMRTNMHVHIVVAVPGYDVLAGARHSIPEARRRAEHSIGTSSI